MVHGNEISVLLKGTLAWWLHSFKRSSFSCNKDHFWSVLLAHMHAPFISRHAFHRHIRPTRCFTVFLPVGMQFCTSNKSCHVQGWPSQIPCPVAACAASSYMLGKSTPLTEAALDLCLNRPGIAFVKNQLSCGKFVRWELKNCGPWGVAKYGSSKLITWVTSFSSPFLPLLSQTYLSALSVTIYLHAGIWAGPGFYLFFTYFCLAALNAAETGGARAAWNHVTVSHQIYCF